MNKNNVFHIFPCFICDEKLQIEQWKFRNSSSSVYCENCSNNKLNNNVICVFYNYRCSELVSAHIAIVNELSFDFYYNSFNSKNNTFPIFLFRRFIKSFKENNNSPHYFISNINKLLLLKE